MKFTLIATLIATGLIAATASAATPAATASSYAGQEQRDIKALSAEDVAAYLAGNGMGLAKAAELNGYAGPAHVLELATQLDLTPDQRARTQALFAAMETKAVALGQALVSQERQLDRLFANKTVTPPLLASALKEIGALTAQVREAHLAAHLAQVKILSAAQNARYAQLRGYAGVNGAGGDGGQHRH